MLLHEFVQGGLMPPEHVPATDVKQVAAQGEVPEVSGHGLQDREPEVVERRLPELDEVLVARNQEVFDLREHRPRNPGCVYDEVVLPLIEPLPELHVPPLQQVELIPPLVEGAQTRELQPQLALPYPPQIHHELLAHVQDVVFEVQPHPLRELLHGISARTPGADGIVFLATGELEGLYVVPLQPGEEVRAGYPRPDYRDLHPRACSSYRK